MPLKPVFSDNQFFQNPVGNFFRRLQSVLDSGLVLGAEQGAYN